MRTLARCAVSIIAAACASDAEAQLPPAALTAPGAPAVFRQDPNAPLTDRDIEFVAKSLTYSAGRPLSGGDARNTDNLTIKGDRAFRDGLKANNLSYVDSIDTGKGFQAILVRDNATGRVVMSVRGTEFGASAEGVKDVGADAAAVATTMTGQAHPGLPQYDAEVKRWVADKMAQHKGNVIVTGHSLGGAHAQRIALDHADKIVAAQTYNAPALETAAIERVANDPKELGKLFDDKGRPKVRHFVGSGDPVSGAGSLHIPGDVVVASGGKFDDPGLLGAHSLMINEPGVRRRNMTVEEYNRIRSFTQVNTRDFGSFLAHVGVETVRTLTELHPAALYGKAIEEPTRQELLAAMKQGREMIEKAAQIREKKQALNERDKAKVEVAKEKAQREEAEKKKTLDAVRAETEGTNAAASPELKKTLEERAERERNAAAERKKAQEQKRAKERTDQAALIALAGEAKKELELPSAAVPNLPPLAPPPPPTQQEIAEVVAAFQALQQQEAQRQRALAAAMASFGAVLSQSFASSGRKSHGKPAASAPAAPSPPAKAPPSCCCGRC
jgi:hypothetical protein